MSLAPEELNLLKRQLLAKGLELSQILSGLLSGRKAGALDLLDAKPGETPVEKARRYLDAVDRKVKALAAGEYGRCQSCNEPIPFVFLDAVPWMDLCQRCHARAGA